MDNWLLIGIGIFIAIDLVLVFWVIYRRRRPQLCSGDLILIRDKWQKIKQTKDKHAILEADKLLDYLLEKHGFTGALGEKLKKAGPRFSDLNGIWSAHKLRNQIAHVLSFEPREQDVRLALSQFEKAFRDLNIKGL